MKAVLAQTRTELRLSLRNGEQLLVNLMIPLGLLGLLLEGQGARTTTPASRSSTSLPPYSRSQSCRPSLVSLGIGTGFERYYGVLKRLGATPLGRPRWVLAKFASVLTIELFQWAILIPVALLLGWSPGSGWLAAAAAAALGTAAFGGLALLLAGTLPGMVNLAACNGLYLVLLVTGGMVIPLSKMHDVMQSVAKLLPARITRRHHDRIVQGRVQTNGASWAVLAAWAVAAPIAAARTFRWD